MRIRNLICVFLVAGVCGFAQQNSGSSQKQPDTSQTTAQHKKKSSPAEANPFPEAESEKAQNKASGVDNGTNSKDYSSSRVDLRRFSPDATRAERLSNGHGGFIHDPQLAARDEKVGKFYLQTGDYKGAYNRFKEASEVAPEDAYAVFGMAKAAEGMGWDKEAITNYTIYLEAIPEGKYSKDARKALKKLASKQKK